MHAGSLSHDGLCQTAQNRVSLASLARSAARDAALLLHGTLRALSSTLAQQKSLQKKYILDKRQNSCIMSRDSTAIRCSPPQPCFQRADEPRGRHALVLQQHEAVTVFERGRKRQHGEGPTVLGGDSSKLTKWRHLGSTWSRSFEEEPAKRGCCVNLFACGAQQEARCLPRAPGSAMKPIYAQVKPSKP